MTAQTKTLLWVAAAAGALLLAAFAAIFAERMIADRNAFRNADAKYALGTHGTDQWTRAEGFLAQPADDLLALSDDRTYRNALLLFQNAQSAISIEWPLHYSAAKRALAAIAENETEAPSRRSVAWNAIGILEFQAALRAAADGDQEKVKKQLAKSTRAFMKAVMLNEANEEARHNLELIQMLNASQKKNGGDPNNQPGSQPPGNGY